MRWTMVIFESKVHDAGRAHDVRGDDRVIGVDEHALQGTLRRRLEGGVDLLDGRRAHDRGEVRDAAVGIGTRSDVPSSRPFMASSTRLVARAAPVDDGTMLMAAARAPQVLVLEVQQVLVIGVGVHRRHETGSMPKASSSTLTIGTKQLVVHEALEMTWSVAAS